MSNTNVTWNNYAQGNITISQNQSTAMQTRAVTNTSQAGTAPRKKNREKRSDFLKEKLFRVNVSYSCHDQAKQPCGSGTRVEILDEIYSWVEDISESSQCFYWLSGRPGAGKSAITASTTKHCIDRNILGAQFFINRDDEATTDPSTIFRTICWQLCNRFPQVAIAVDQILRAQPTLVDDNSVEDQAKQLFVDAIKAAATNPQRPLVVVIDALDETDIKHLQYLSRILSNVMVDLPCYAKVFISSRAEHVIITEFDRLRSRIQLKSRYLTTEKSREEVSQLMEKKIREILEDNDLDWDSWGDDRMKTLSSHAAGLYMWAETALAFLKVEIGKSGCTYIEQFSYVLKDQGMEIVNTLYLNLLRRTFNLHHPHPDDWEYEHFRRIVGAILVRQTPLSIADMEQLLNIREPQYHQKVDLVHFVRQYRTVLVNHSQKIDGLVVPRVHKSFADFITSEWAHEFRVDKILSHREIALQCLNKLFDLDAYLMKMAWSFPKQLVYASQHWRLHLTRMLIHQHIYDHLSSLVEVEGENEYHTLDILEEDGIKSLPVEKLYLERWTKVPIVAEMQSFAFSPDGTQIASSHEYLIIQILDARTGLVTVSLNTNGVVLSMGFSPDGTRLVSACHNGIATIWEVQTKKQLHVLQSQNHPIDVCHVVFSNDGEKVATCSAVALSGTLRCWSARTGQQFKEFEYHIRGYYPPKYCTFSPNDQHIASLSHHTNGEILVWDLDSGSLISCMRHYQCRMIAFCAYGCHLISHAYECGWTIMWDPKSGKQLSRVEEAKPTFAPLSLGLVKYAEQGSTCSCIDSLQTLDLGRIDNWDVSHVFTLDTICGPVHGIVEHGRGVWGLTWNFAGLKGSETRRRLVQFVAGATTVRW